MFVTALPPDWRHAAATGQDRVDALPRAIAGRWLVNQIENTLDQEMTAGTKPGWPPLSGESSLMPAAWYRRTGLGKRMVTSVVFNFKRFLAGSAMPRPASGGNAAPASCRQTRCLRPTTCNQGIDRRKGTKTAAVSLCLVGCAMPAVCCVGAYRGRRCHAGDSGQRFAHRVTHLAGFLPNDPRSMHTNEGQQRGWRRGAFRA